MSTPRASRFETPTGRLKLPIKKRPYVVAKLAGGVFLTYRRCKSPGSWGCKASDDHGRYWESTLKDVVADDFERADGSRVIDYFRACKLALAMGRGGTEEGGGRPPTTVSMALAWYEQDLIANGASTYNARYARFHLANSPLLQINRWEPCAPLSSGNGEIASPKRASRSTP